MEKTLQPGENNSPPFLELGLGLVMIAAPVFFGSVHLASEMLLSAALLLLFFLNTQSNFKPFTLLFSAGLIIHAVFFSLISFLSFVELLKWAGVGAGILMIQKLTLSSVIRLLFLIVFLGSLESFYGLFQVMTGHENVLWQIKTSHQGFVTGTYMNRNHYAGFMEVSLGVHAGCIWLTFEKQRILRGLCLVLLFAVNMFALFQSGSRMGLFSFAASCALVSFFFLFIKPKQILLISAGSICLLIGIQISGASEVFFERLSDNAGGRFQAWSDVVQMIKRYPLGIGLGNFSWVFPQYQSASLRWGWTHAHQDYLELIAELGVGLFSAGSAILAVYFSRIFSFRKFYGENTPLFYGGFIGLIALFIHGFFDFNFAVPANALIWFFLLAFMWKLRNL